MSPEPYKDWAGAALDVSLIAGATAALCTGHIQTELWMAVIGPLVGGRVAFMRQGRKLPGGSTTLALAWWIVPMLWGNHVDIRA